VPDRKDPVFKHIPSTAKVEKPWGSFEQYTYNLPSTVKIITVAPGGVLSRQYHHRRDELWVMLDEGACVELDGESSTLMSRRSSSYGACSAMPDGADSARL
jgi:mannose-6-phosphate isomerase-like protein (cupin superfamily)